MHLVMYVNEMANHPHQIRLDQPDKEWTTLNAWFVRQLDFNVRFSKRI